MHNSWRFASATQLVFGVGAVQQLGELVRRRGVRRLAMITDKALLGAGVVTPALDSLSKAGVEVAVFEDGQPEPSLRVAEHAIQYSATFRPEAILGLGGGSNMDVAKAVAAVLSHGGSPRDYFGTDTVPAPVMPLICVPTTAGTGSEVTSAMVLNDTENQIKAAGLSEFLRPALALVDPELTRSCPPQVTADSGIDALTHAIESYTSVDYRELSQRNPPGETSPFSGCHPLGDCLAEKAIELIGQYLVTAVNMPDDMAAREGMALAATLAAMSFSSCGVALVHALEYPLGGALHVSHGAGNGLLLPYVMRYNLPIRIARFARIAQMLGQDIQGRTDRRAAEQAVEAIIQLKRDIGIPERLRDIGATAEMLPRFAEKTHAIQRLLRVNPREPTEQDILDILQAAL